MENKEFCLNDAKTYKAKLWNSTVIYKDKKSLEDKRKNIPNKLKTNRIKYSNDFKIDSDFK